MRRMLDPTKVGGLPSTIEFDKEGNRNVKKNLGVGGKLTLKSLVSDTNPDGDITKELGGGGGGKMYRHTIAFLKPNFELYLDLYSTIATSFTFAEFNASISNKVTCTGLVKVNSIQGQPVTICYKSSTKDYQIYYIDSNGEGHATSTNGGSVSLSDEVTPVE